MPDTVLLRPRMLGSNRVCVICKRRDPDRDWFAACLCEGDDKWSHQNCMESYVAIRHFTDHLRNEIVACPRCNIPYRYKMVDARADNLFRSLTTTSRAFLVHLVNMSNFVIDSCLQAAAIARGQSPNEVEQGRDNWLSIFLKLALGVCIDFILLLILKAFYNAGLNESVSNTLAYMFKGKNLPNHIPISD